MSQYTFQTLIEFNFDASSIDEAEEMFDAVVGQMGFWVGRHRSGSAIILDSGLVDCPNEEDDDE